ncbi:MAG: hypothetical protein JXQ75_01185 [Phycisphaerae bacterium]|nr:hypothetical protein [Phycisphaerae bacterium]
MNWIIFGDDWGRHLSTTQHLVAQFPAEDRIVWVNSMGMRRPRLSRADFRRAAEKIFGRGASAKPSNDAALRRRPDVVVQPRVLPWHTSGLVRSFNRRCLGRQLRSAMRAAGLVRPHVLTTNPVAVLYLDEDRASLTYLRLDDYAKLPGVDVDVVESCEQALFDKADHIVVTARALMLAEERLKSKTHYLPQGVDVAHYGGVPLEPPGTKVLGFFGLLAEWLDYELVAAVARACPDWTLEFVGPDRYFPDDLRAVRNICVLPPVSYGDLPGVVAGWSAAWVPFLINDLTRGVNPLKLREYLAAGLPALSTPLPEAMSLVPALCIVRAAEDVRRELSRIPEEDSPGERAKRREAMKEHSWAARAAELRRVVSSESGARKT